MNKITRRSFLRSAAAAPIVAPVLGHAALEQVKAQGMVTGASGLVSRGGETPCDTTCNQVGGSDKSFSKFASWFKAYGQDEIRDELRHFSGFDPDIMEMRLPLVTKMRMQQKREFRRRKVEQKRKFAKALLQGFPVGRWLG